MREGLRAKEHRASRKGPPDHAVSIRTAMDHDEIIVRGVGKRL